MRTSSSKKPKSTKIKLPPYVSIKREQYIYRPYIKKSERGQIKVDKYGYATPIILGKVTETPIPQLYQILSGVLQQHEYAKNHKYMSLAWLYEQYTHSTFFKKLEPPTQKRYRGCSALLERPIKIDGLPSTVGDLRADQFTSVQLRKLLDKRFEQLQAEGKKGGAQCNNELALIGSMYKFGKQYIDELAKIESPSKGITKYPVSVRTRYVTQEDYAIQYSIAQQVAPDYLPIVMELTYLLAARGCEVVDLLVGDGNERGIIVNRRKGSKTTLVRWSPRLRDAWNAACKVHPHRMNPDDALVTTKFYEALNKSSVDDAWQKVHQEMINRGLEKLYFTWHDLKRRGISNAKDNKIAGHKSESMRQRYKVNIEEFDAPE